MATTGLGISLRIQDALIKAGVQRDLCWATETGAVNVHDPERAIVDVHVGKSGGPSWEYGARDNLGDYDLARGGLERVAAAVASHTRAALSA